MGEQFLQLFLRASHRSAMVDPWLFQTGLLWGLFEAPFPPIAS